jgi:hypothetical protein
MYRQFRYLSIFVMMGLPMLAQAADPVLLSTWPASAKQGDQIRLNGHSFGNGSATRTVILRDRSSARHAMSIVAWHDSVIAVVVPADAAPGVGSIVILTGATESSRVPFTVLNTLKPVKGAGFSQPIPPPLRVTIPVAATKPCSNPAAYRVDFNLLPKHTKFTGRVSITGVIKNLGGSYETRPNQQLMSLYEDSRMVASAPFGNLAPGQEASVNYQRDWNVSTEFPPTYKLIISYDPDILLDSNKQNDDCNNGDNNKTRSGVEINRLF